MPRIVHIAGSFVVVLVAYWTYALLAVPMIEPRAGRPSGSADVKLPPLPNRSVKELEGLFAPGSWELQEPKVLESDRAILLVQKYETQDGGWVDLFPFTVVFLPQGDSSEEAERTRGAVVLQAPDGARLRFDQAFDLRRMKIGRLVEGRLRGPLTIRSQGKLPGPEDDLLVTTRDVELNEQHVSTEETVDFRWGAHAGRGRGMHIQLLPGEAPRGKSAGPNIGGIESFEIRSVERLRLDLAGLPGAQGKKPPVPANETAAKAMPAAGAKKETPSAAPPLPVEVTCRGPFLFNMVQQVATFKDQVDVMRIHPSGPSDHLSCQLLSIFFAKAAQAAPPAGKTPRMSGMNLQPQRIEARGNPVMLHAPENRVTARGERLEYDLLAARIVLEDAQGVVLQQDANEIHSPAIEYHVAPAGRLGRLKAKGPGWLRGRMDERPGQVLEAHWKTELQVRPQDKNQVISLTGGAQLKFQQIGQLDARSIHFWLTELAGPLAPGQRRFQPDRMLAEEEVRVNSPQLSSGVQRLEIWFDAKEPAVKALGPEAGMVQPSVATEGQGLGGGEREPRAASPAGAAPPGAAPPGVTDRAPQTPVPEPQTSSPPSRRQHMEIVGRLLRARVQVTEKEADLAELTIEGDARLRETQTADPSEQPLLVAGEQIRVENANLPQTGVTVTGLPQRPACFEGRGLSLLGPNINLNRGSNRLWVDGPGQMKLPLDRDLEGRPLERPQLLQVDWKRRMHFDGRTAQFVESVVARGPAQHLQTQALDIQLREPVRFAATKLQQQPQAEQLLCRGGVLLENHAMLQDRQVSRDRMQVADLAINLSSGALTAGGPGWLASVRRGASEATPAPGGLPVTGVSLPLIPAPASRDALTCLHMRFLGAMSGNIHRRELVFHDQVQTAYGPADSWETVLDVDNPSVQGGVLRCDCLQVNDLTPMGSGGRDVELLCSGNVVAEGRASDGKTYTARATRMSFAQAKDLLVLEGNGRSEAELFLQESVGGLPSKTAAQKILFWPQSHRTKIEGVRSLEIQQFPGQPGKKQFVLPGFPGAR